LGGGEHEYETHSEVEGEDVAGFDPADCHEAAGEETVECVEALGCCEDVGCNNISLACFLFKVRRDGRGEGRREREERVGGHTRGRGFLASFFAKVNEIVGNSNLGSNIAELRPDG
jgi:hypothetical protein